MQKKFVKGISLLELIIYIAIFSVIAVVMVQFFLTSLSGRNLVNARFEVSQNMRFASERIRQTIYDASVVSVSGSCPLNTLNATSTTGATSSIFATAGGVLQMSDATGTYSLTTNLVSATTTAVCMFNIISNPAPAKNTVQTFLQIVYNSTSTGGINLSNANESQEFTTSLR